MIFPYHLFDSHGLMELCDLAKRNYSLQPDDNLLLLHFATHSPSSAYDIVNRSSMPSAKSSRNVRDTSLQQFFDSMYKDTQKRIRNLAALKLIEEITVNPNPRNAKYYQLTTYGVYYVITKLSSTYGSIRNLLIGYGDHPLFRYYVYPWLSRNSLLKVNADTLSLFSQVSLYLRDCCMIVNDTLDYLNWPDDLCIWEKIRTGSEDAKALSDFLSKKIGGHWPNKVDIQKSDGVLEIRRPIARSVLIHLNLDRKRAIIYYKNKKEIELQVRKFFNQTIIQRPRRLDENYMKGFTKTHLGIVQRFIFSVASDDSIDLNSVNVLAQDSVFKEALKSTRLQFEQRYKIFSKTS